MDKTITRAALEKAADDLHMLRRDAHELVAALGLTIADPSPPKAMVKLAQKAVIAAGPVGEWHVWEAGYLAALQHVENGLRELPQYRTLGDNTLIDRTAALKIVGAA